MLRTSWKELMGTSHQRSPPTFRIVDLEDRYDFVNNLVFFCVQAKVELKLKYKLKKVLQGWYHDPNRGCTTHYIKEVSAV